MSHWIITDRTKPWTANAERRWHYHKRAQMVSSTRERFFWLAKQAGVPRLEACVVTAVPCAANRRSMADVAACYPTVKAAIDGIVDAGVLPDDDPRHLQAVTFLPTDVTGFDGLTIHILTI